VGSDILLWNRFINAFPTYFEKVAYDVHIGKGVDVPPDLDPRLQDMAKILTQKRIDVIGVKNGVYTIVEVKQYAGTTAVGQLMVYHQLISEDYPFMVNASLLIVTDVLQPDMKDFCRVRKIDVVELGPIPTA